MGRPASEASPSDFGLRVRELRESAQIAQVPLSYAAGFSKSVVWQVEAGLIQKPSAELVWALAKALGTTPEYLLYGAGRRPSRTEVQAAFVAAMEEQPLRTGT